MKTEKEGQANTQAVPYVPLSTKSRPRGSTSYSASRSVSAPAIPEHVSSPFPRARTSAAPHVHSRRSAKSGRSTKPSPTILFYAGRGQAPDSDMDTLAAHIWRWARSAGYNAVFEGQWRTIPKLAAGEGIGEAIASLSRLNSYARIITVEGTLTDEERKRFALLQHVRYLDDEENRIAILKVIAQQGFDFRTPTRLYLDEQKPN